jgi:chemotaxis protein MotB
MAGHGGGAWKVAYADFVTAMMAFFLVMWITGQSQETKEAISGYFQDPWGTSSDHAAPASLLPTELHGDVQSLDMPQKLPPGKKPGAADSDEIDFESIAKSRWAQKRKVHFLEDGDRTTPALVIVFDESSAELTDAAKAQLDKLIPNLVGKLNKIEVRGHSTRRPLASDSLYADLWQLCYARCQATMAYMQQRGIEAERLRLSQSAAYEPLSSRVETVLQGENARVEVFLLNEVADLLPGIEQESDAKADGTADAHPAD